MNIFIVTVVYIHIYVPYWAFPIGYSLFRVACRTGQDLYRSEAKHMAEQGRAVLKDPAQE